MLPKIIHYCWFGRNPKPDIVKKCITSWRHFCPDYQIIEWNEENFDIQECPDFVRDAYTNKKWAFVSDYARLKGSSGVPVGKIRGRNARLKMAGYILIQM